MYHTTGFAKDEIIDLCALVYANEEDCDIDPWPPSLGLYKSVSVFHPGLAHLSQLDHCAAWRC